MFIESPFSFTCEAPRGKSETETLKNKKNTFGHCGKINIMDNRNSPECLIFSVGRGKPFHEQI